MKRKKLIIIASVSGSIVCSIVCIGVLLMLVVNLTGYTQVELLTAKETYKNYLVYKERITQTGRKYDVEFITEEAENGYYDLVGRTNGKEEITITICNYADADTQDEGREDFWVEYIKPEEAEYNVDLFVDIVNVVSGREITKEFCQEFIEDPENKYEDEPDDFEKSSKYHWLNFWEDWSISQETVKDGTDHLSFWGLTKTGCK